MTRTTLLQTTPAEAGVQHRNGHNWTSAFAGVVHVSVGQ